MGRRFLIVGLAAVLGAAGLSGCLPRRPPVVAPPQPPPLEEPAPPPEAPPDVPPEPPEPEPVPEPEPPPPATVAPEQGYISRDGIRFSDEQGRLWRWQGVTGFMLLARTIQGEDPAPFLRWAQSLGANVVRVLGGVAWGPATRWGDWRFGIATVPPEQYYAALVRLADAADAIGIRLEFVPLADAKYGVHGTLAQQQVHWRSTGALVANRWNVFIELCNECDLNGPDITQFSRLPGRALQSHGSNGVEGRTITPTWDYAGIHAGRDREWPRKCGKQAYDLQSQPDAGFAAIDVPVVDDEPMGADEIERTGQGTRSNNAEDFFDCAVSSGLLAQGFTYHFEAGMTATIPPPESRQQAIAEAIATAWRLIPPACGLGTYTRTGLEGAPLAPDYPQVLRTFFRIAGADACGVSIRPGAGWTPSGGVNGWSVVRRDGTRQNVVFLRR